MKFLIGMTVAYLSVAFILLAISASKGERGSGRDEARDAIAFISSTQQAQGRDEQKPDAKPDKGGGRRDSQ